MTENQNPLVLDKNEEISEQKADDIRVQLRQDPEVQRIAQQIDVKNQMELLEYGKEPAVEISKFSDRILNMMKTTSVTDSGTMLTQLGKIMDRFDKNDFDEPKGFLAKMFKRGNSMIEKIFQKYRTLGGEIEKIHVEISKYKDEMAKTNHTLEEMYENNINYYMELEKYVVAGQMKLEEMQALIPSYEEKAGGGNQLAQMQLDTLRDGLQALEERVYDLDMARMVALQTAPQIRLLQRGNTKLIGKINSAFVITIPIFKNGIIQAVTVKRQKLVADSMSELDRRTNEMLKRNAENISNQSVEIARMAGRPSIDIETIETSWNTIVSGMQETKQIEEENRRIREDGAKRIQQLQDNIKNAVLKN
ncbi:MULTISPECIES: toxic anion resistance protein [Bacillus]|uniref:toxic anion resistance protein n=1 Tax=Bacillus TaxID=1386 RepID=UPI00066FD637|nr:MULTISPECIES: toxic anion resistance protein [Bacillus]MED0773550.1 toxic anion resistance protein [Bacillus siamensis]MED0775327.1 toxic anion resistance protein [Bacillus siamensis]MED0781372.1 toxic anion resistance protein [Bacillus siamensis]MED0834848.1 toxic anion resistance protein [Bacillus siamensis]